VRQRTQLINAMRAHLAELGLDAATGREGVQALIAVVRDEASTEIDSDRANLHVDGFSW
jgi:transposase